MKLPPLVIHAASSYSNTYSAQDSSLKDLKPVLKEHVENVPRRLTRFVQLALIGASRCVGQLELPEKTGVYFASCRGDTGVTNELINELVRDRHPPAPLNFVNSVSNAACFYVAKVFGLYGRSNFVSNYFDPIVAALSAAQLDFSVSAAPAAFVGSVDSCSAPLANHRRRLFVDATQAVAEASNWLLISRKDGDLGDKLPVLGYIDSIYYFDSLAAFCVWLEGNADLVDAELWRGQHLSNEASTSIQNASSITICKDYIRHDAYYDSPTGEAIEQFLSGDGSNTMLHVNADPSGRYTVLQVSRAE